MKKLIFFILFVSIKFGHSKLYSYVAVEEHVRKVGERCIRDAECILDGFCERQVVCTCDPHYLPSSDNTMCIATVGAQCKGDFNCRTMSNAQCRQDVCACQDNFVVDNKNISRCRSKPKRQGDFCQNNKECEEAIGQAQCLFNIEQCRCNTKHHFVNETSKCVQSRNQFESCNHDYECFFENEYSSVLKCHQDHHKCCTKDDAQCKGSILHIGTMLIVLPLLLLWTL